MIKTINIKIKSKYINELNSILWFGMHVTQSVLSEQKIISPSKILRYEERARLCGNIAKQMGLNDDFEYYMHILKKGITSSGSKIELDLNKKIRNNGEKAY